MIDWNPVPAGPGVAERNRAIAPVLIRFGRIKTWAQTSLESLYQTQRSIEELPADLDEALLRELDQAARTAELALERLLKSEEATRRAFLARYPVTQA